MDNRNKPFMIRLRPETRELLDRAAQDQRRSRASLVDQAVREHLEGRYSEIGQRVTKLLGVRQ